MAMGMFAVECHWIVRRRLLLVALAVVIGKLLLLVGVEAQIATPPNIRAPAIPPGLNIPPLPQQASQYLNDKIGQYLAAFESTNSDCLARSDEQTTFDRDSLVTVSTICMQNETDFVLRLCEQKEIELYVDDIGKVQAFGVPSNINCNLSNWPIACNPGWAAATAFNYTIPTNAIPIRVSNAQMCCPGFFCPRGLTCMIPCPMGAFCPLASYNTFTRSCAPYYYPALPGGNQCGGADLWLSETDTKGIFCGGFDNSGTYCPDATTKLDCQKGHFCRVGSTVQTKCSLFARCNKYGIKSQNLKIQGMLLVVVLSVSLLVIYTCSDQCLHIRERRKDKALETAARQAKQRASAAERWRRAIERGTKKKAKECGAKTKPVMLTNTQSSKSHSEVCTSGTHSSSSESLHIEQQPLKAEPNSTDPRVLLGWADNDLEKREYVVNLHINPTSLSAPGMGNLRNRTSPSGAGSSQSSWSRDLYPDEGPRSIDLYDAVQLSPVISEVSAKEEGLPSVKEIKDVRWKALAHTTSQIYKYAYGEIEKEKVKNQSKPGSVKKVVESDGFRVMLAGPRRLEIELKFIDLCLVLKGSGRKLLSFVTGELRPRRVTAVMGPSGAGKTTFLNALAGKETGSVITGQVFINGVPGSIQAYKRIIGFVPQDDIVHGSLTVEENLSFSAKYRLPVEMPRQDRVLVVERIINRLNLTSIRNSLVGTVENRGISGGQRKRVNVGLELVIEPSLLLLDEPTSGLDSTSSRLVVQALAREAALGVNVCLVVHQPSNGLFRMFDDVILLAKDGYTVYIGPTAEMEAYFSSLDLEVPDRTNPPDYYMDVLEGEAMPDNDPSFDVKSLPILWMCHHGYPIPVEMQETADGQRAERGDPLRITFDTPKTFVQEIWHELRAYVLVRSDILKTTFKNVKSLSGRQTPGFSSQYFLILRRATKQRFRESRLVVQDYLILLIAGICLGLLSNWKDVEVVETAYVYTIICLSLLVMIASLRTFTVDKLQFWRESSSGVHRLAYFLAKDSVDHFNTICKPVVFLSTFYFYNAPRASFRSTYIVILALTYCCTGIAYVVAILLKPQPGQLICVFVPVVATLLVSESQTGLLQKIQNVSYAFWAHQAYIVSNAEKYTGVWLVERCLVLRKYGYSIHNFNICIAILICYGLGARLLAFLCLIFYNRERQK